MCHILETFLFIMAEVLNGLMHKEVSFTYLKNYTQELIPAVPSRHGASVPAGDTRRAAETRSAHRPS